MVHSGSSNDPFPIYTQPEIAMDGWIVSGIFQVTIDEKAVSSNLSHPNYINTTYHLCNGQSKSLMRLRVMSCGIFEESIQLIKDEVMDFYAERFGSQLDVITNNVIVRYNYKETACKYDAKEVNEIYAQLVDKTERQVRLVLSLRR
eukprot:1164606_1